MPDLSRHKALLEKLVDDNSFEYFAKNGATRWQKFVSELTGIITESG